MLEARTVTTSIDGSRDARPILEARSITKSFGGNRAVDDVSFTVEAGTITGLIGPNGAGKTTLFNCLAGHFPPTSGSLALDGERIDGLGSDEIFLKGLARTFQIPKPFPEMTVLENVMVAPKHQSGERFWHNWLRPGRVAAEERRLVATARHWIDFVGLSHLADQPARVLSGGQRKLLELARILVAEPRLILLDEPAAGVNPTLLEAIVDRIETLNRQGVTFLIIEHNMDLVMKLCRPIMVMAQGRLLMTGDAQEVRSDPRVVEAYLGGAAA
ncbi:MAG TPA: ABC transporter ATP-binding protein [Microvirga sp.]|jgi:branched-chain amino acid transport system ATP-binding protein